MTRVGSRSSPGAPTGLNPRRAAHVPRATHQRRRLRALAARLALSAAALGPAPAPGASPAVVVWRLQSGRVQAPPGAPRGPLAVGSLQKPFVVKAWALTHPDATPPRVVCTPGSVCWHPSGHGPCDLRRALAVSCNTYFEHLARDTPPDTLTQVLRAEGFVLADAPSPAGAIGLPDARAHPGILPEVLLEAYARLVKRPWPVCEPVRRVLLQGLRDAARSGTARGLARRGYWAKTGTAPALDGTPLQTSGWALALDDAGTGWLALLPRGTGTEAAAALGAWLNSRGDDGDGAREPPARARPDGAVPPGVRVHLLAMLAPRRLWADNAGTAPVPASGRHPDLGTDWVGPGVAVALEPGVHLGRGLWQLRAPEFGFVRRLEAELWITRAPRGGPDVIALVPLEEYVQGVADAEAPEAAPALREELAAAVLRFLALGPRHAPRADVCDATHCAVFGGRGPRLVWLSPRHARPDPRGATPAAFDAPAWTRVHARAREPGPRRFSGHCGGAPLSELYVWGAGDSSVSACPRHAPGTVTPWRRRWPRAELRRAFGAEPDDVRVDDRDGTWHLVVALPTGTRRLLYDDAHRALAAVSGWDALPSPATGVRRTTDGFDAEGVGAGHRVGLCLGAPGPTGEGSPHR